MKKSTKIEIKSRKEQKLNGTEEKDKNRNGEKT